MTDESFMMTHISDCMHILMHVIDLSEQRRTA
jgi:hypothetical protein